ncbi:MAG: hypothetical protein H6831_08875 [Planctomycetes bacterium]|nr:hypothetical protein [Planctomycetota bacterium]MCB9904504.1 hypothetical protein [Planctomycetota bacterium]
MSTPRSAEEDVLRKQRLLRPIRRLLPLLPKWGPFGFLRYGLTQLDSGDLRVGDAAPDAPVVALDGSPGSLLAHLTGKPLVLVFGSFT